MLPASFTVVTATTTHQVSSASSTTQLIPSTDSKLRAITPRIRSSVSWNCVDRGLLVSFHDVAVLRQLNFIMNTFISWWEQKRTTLLENLQILVSIEHCSSSELVEDKSSSSLVTLNKNWIFYNLISIYDIWSSMPYNKPHVGCCNRTICFRKFQNIVGCIASRNDGKSMIKIRKRWQGNS